MNTRSPTGEECTRATRAAAVGLAVTSSALSCDIVPVFDISNERGGGGSGFVAWRRTAFSLVRNGSRSVVNRSDGLERHLLDVIRQRDVVHFLRILLTAGDQPLEHIGELLAARRVSLVLPHEDPRISG